MAIRDLLWACPFCGLENSIEPARKGELCSGCGTRFRRGRRALITALQPDGKELTLRPAEWLDRLPDLGIEERVREAIRERTTIRSSPATLRSQTGTKEVHFRGRYLNQIERLGKPVSGILRLEPDHLSFGPEPGAEGGERGGTPQIRIWDFSEITAVQPSSSTLQINSSTMPLASFRVEGDSVRLWEELICTALRCYYRDSGRGEIIEFQPRISLSRNALVGVAG